MSFALEITSIRCQRLMAIRHTTTAVSRCPAVRVNVPQQGFKTVIRCGNLITVIDVPYEGHKTYRRRHKEDLHMRSKLHMVYGVFEVDR